MSNVSLVDGHIDEPKFTEEQIMKAMECCMTENGNDCDDCSYSGVTYKQGEGGCCNKLTRDALELIDRKNAQIEEYEAKLAHQAETIHILEKALADRMKELEDSRDGHIRTAAEKDAEIERLRMQQSELIADYKQIAINAMKKFVERFKTKLSNFEYRDENPNMKQKGEWILHEVIPVEVDKLLKEMGGDKS